MWDFDSRDEDVTCRDKTRHRGVARIWEAGGGARNIFSYLQNCMSRSDLLHMAKPSALLGVFGGMHPLEFLCNLLRFSVYLNYFDPILACN